MKHILLIVIALFLLIGEKISNFFFNHLKHIIISGFLLSIIIPITISIKTGWEIPEFIIGYIFILIIIGLIYFAGESDKKYYNRSHGYNNYDNINYNNVHFHNNYHNNNSEWAQKRRNGGITDEELILRKKMIRKNLKNKKVAVK